MTNVVKCKSSPPTTDGKSVTRWSFNDFALLSGAYATITYIYVSILVVI